MRKKLPRREIIDPSEKSNVYEGNLAYGRCSGETPVIGKDFPADRLDDGKPKNLPVAPLILVSPRDPEVWSNRELKPKRKKIVNKQYFQNYVIKTYLNYIGNSRSNFHLMVDKSRL